MKYLYNEDYDGTRFTYGLTYRQVYRFAVPDGWIIQYDKESEGFRYGTIDYPRELTEEEIYKFELTFVVSG